MDDITFGKCEKIEKEQVKHCWERVTVPLGDRSYEILIGPGILLELPDFIKKTGNYSSVFMITDSNVEEYVGHDLIRLIDEEKQLAPVHMLSFPAGEASKNIDTVISLARQMVQKGADRSSLILALGGGVTGDIAAFLASIYMRGIDFIQLPTTLLSQVDSAVGGKTGVDLPEGKNLIGTFAQPKGVLADIGVLTSLPAQEIRNGISEIVKYGMIKDRTLFETMESQWWDIINLEPQITSFLVRRSCEIKAEVVSQDEKEGGYRRILNFGHTIGHAVEAASGYTISHGEAVAMGMVTVAKISEQRGFLSTEELKKLISLLDCFSLPTSIPGEITTKQILDNIKKDKKARAGKVSFVLSKGIGNTLITDDVTDEEISKAIGR